MADNEFGYTSWGRDWVRLAEPMNVTRPEPLLPRARSIARNNGVQLEIEGRHIRASIHRGGQASVTYLEVAALPAAAVSAIAAAVPPGAVTLDDAVRRTLSDAGISLAPKLLVIDCSCPARNPRCVHLLATCYDIARRVDENPWLALDLQDYRATAEATPDADVPPPRWTSIDNLDPATYFAAPAS